MPKYENESGGQEGSFDLMRYLYLINERKGLFVSIALVIMFSALVVSYAMPRKYEAKSILFIEHNVIRDLVKGIAITPSMETKIKAIRVTMLSRSLITKVIKQLDMDVALKEGVSVDSIIKKLQNTIKVSLDEKRGVVIIRYSDNNPVLARDVVNTLTRIYIEENTSLKRKESFEATRFLAEQIKVYKNRIDEAKKDIDEFKLESGKILSSDEVSVRARIEEYQDELEQVRMEINSLETSRKVLINSSPMREKITSLEQELTQLRVRYTEQHPRVKSLKSTIDELEREFSKNREAQMNQVYRSQEYQSLKVRIASLRVMEERLEDKIADNKEILLKMPKVQTQLAELERKREKEVLIYEQLVSRYGQSEVSKEMELQDKSVYFRILDPAVVPASPASPNRPLIDLMGIFMGLGLGFGVVFLLDMISPTVKSVDALRELGVPVLAVIPKVKGSLYVVKERRRTIRIWAIAALGILVVLSFAVVEFFGLGVVDLAIKKISASM